MKTLVLLLIGMALSQTSKQVYATVDPRQIKNMQVFSGLTTNYTQMLMNENNYFVSKGVPATTIDISKQVQLGVKPHDKNLGYAYGELQDTESLKQKRIREAFTSDYHEMLQNPEKKMLLLGLHPEMGTLDTKTIKPPMEDPIIVRSPEDQKAYMDMQQARLDQKTKDIEEYLSTIHQTLISQSKVVTKDQMQVVHEIADYLNKNPNSTTKHEIQQLQDTLTQVNTLFDKQGSCKVQDTRLKAKVENTKKELQKQEQKEEKNEKKKEEPKEEQKDSLRMSNFVKLSIKEVPIQKEEKENSFSESAEEDQRLSVLRQQNAQSLKNLLSDEASLEKSLAQTQEVLGQKMRRLKSQQQSI